jgi:thiol-disulfide isomerase/thioredoxin
MKKTTTIIVLALLCLNFWSKAQNPVPLKLGEKIPQHIWQQKMPAINYDSLPADSLSLSTYAGKIIILDFWATWCTSCIIKFETISGFEQKYQDKIKFILVDTKSTKDTPERINGVLRGEKAPFVKYNLVTIYNDTLLNALFPHKYIPHYVWLGSNGKVLAITNTTLLNQQTIDSILASDAKNNKEIETLNNNEP